MGEEPSDLVDISLLFLRMWRLLRKQIMIDVNTINMLTRTTPIDTPSMGKCSSFCVNVGAVSNCSSSGLKIKHNITLVSLTLGLLVTPIVILTHFISRINQCYWEWSDCLNRNMGIMFGINLNKYE